MNLLKRQLITLQAILMLAAAAQAATITTSFYTNHVTLPYNPGAGSIWVYDAQGQRVTSATSPTVNFYGQGTSGYGSFTVTLPGAGLYSFSYPAQTGGGRWWTNFCTVTDYGGGNFGLSPSSLPSPESFPLAAAPSTTTVFPGNIDINGNEIDFGSLPSLFATVPASVWFIDPNGLRLHNYGTVYTANTAANLNSSWAWEMWNHLTPGVTPTALMTLDVNGLQILGSPAVTVSTLPGLLPSFLTSLTPSTLSVGPGNTVGANSVTIGNGSTSSGTYSLSVGDHVTSASFGQVTIGRYNVTPTLTPTAGSWVSDDDLFVVGNGTSNAARSNALTIKKNGTTTINGTTVINGSLFANSSMAIGPGSQAGANSIAVGDHALAYGVSSAVIGSGSAGGLNSIGLGGNATAQGAIGMGGATSNGIYSLSFGLDSLTEAANAVAIGLGADAKGSMSIALGYNLIAETDNQTVIGRFNRSRDFNNDAVPGLFVIGNGTFNPPVRSNAMRVLEDGTVLIRPSGDLPMDDGQGNSFTVGDQP